MKKRIKLFAFLVWADMALAVGLIHVVSSYWMGSLKNASSDEVVLEPRIAALTFDDGPNSVYTERLLDGLKERGVKASFFLLGTCIEGNEDIVRRMDDEGHLIGVHCMQHTQLTKISRDDAVNQLEKTQEMIEEIIGQHVEYVRPPFGAWNEALEEVVYKELAMEVVLWDVDSVDWELRNRAAIVEKVIRKVESGDIILMHDEFQTSVDAALEIIDILTAKGYTFVTVNELMVD